MGVPEIFHEKLCLKRMEKWPLSLKKRTFFTGFFLILQCFFTSGRINLPDLFTPNFLNHSPFPFLSVSQEKSEGENFHFSFKKMLSGFSLGQKVSLASLSYLPQGLLQLCLHHQPQCFFPSPTKPHGPLQWRLWTQSCSSWGLPPAAQAS